MKHSFFIALLQIGLFANVATNTNVLEWQKLDGPYGGGTITCLHYDEEGNTIWAGSSNFGLFKSTDMAQSWQQMPILELFGKGIDYITQRGEFLYVACWDKILKINLDTFSLESVPIGSAKKMCVDSAQKIFAVTASYELVLFNPATRNVVNLEAPTEWGFFRDIELDNNESLYALADDSLFYSNDKGLSWIPFTPEGGFKGAQPPSALKVMPSGEIVVIVPGYAGYYFDDCTFKGYMYYYSPLDGWTYKESIPANMDRISSLQIHGNVICAWPGWYSVDFGTTWSLVPFAKLSSLPTNYSSKAILYVPGSQFIASDVEDLYVSNDNGDTWKPSNYGLNFSKKLDFHPNGDFYVTTARGRIFRKSIATLWEMVTNPPGSNYPRSYDGFSGTSINSAPGLFVWAVPVISGYAFSTNDGVSWDAKVPAYNSHLVTNSKGFIYFPEFESGFLNIYKSTDNGLTISKVLSLPSSQCVVDLCVDSEDLIYLYVGKTSKLYISNDDGKNWAFYDVPNLTNYKSCEVEDVSLSINPLGHIFCSIYAESTAQAGATADFSQLLNSKDGGKTWVSLESVFPSESFSRIFASQDGLLYRYSNRYKHLEADRKIYLSDDNGATWLAQDWEKNVQQLKERGDGSLYAVTTFQGIYVAKTPTEFTPQMVYSHLLPSNQTYGVNWVDYNNDGNEDLFLVNQGPNQLYRNNGDGTFTKAVMGLVFSDNEPSRAATWGDYDNDGDEDVFVTNEGARCSLFRNEDYERFIKIENQPMTQQTGSYRGCAWADYDNDGWLDLYVCNRNGNNFLFRNLGSGQFKPIEIDKITTDADESYGCSWCDYDLDGRLDLFVANKGQNALYKQISTGRFIRLPSAQFPDDGLYSFGGSWGDFNNDCFPDLFVTNADGNNSLYFNNGDGSFKRLDEWPFNVDGGVSKGSGWADYDNDGDLDLFVANNGSSFFYVNDGFGHFDKIGIGSFVDYNSNSLSVAWGDADNDGEQDLFLGAYDFHSLLYKNKAETKNWIKVKCVGTISNKSGLGAIVKILTRENGVSKWQMRQISSQTGHASANSAIAHFGIGNANRVDSLVVIWPSGVIDNLKNAIINNLHVIDERSYPVPVELVQFKVTQSPDGNILTWETGSESKNYGFEVYRRVLGNPKVSSAWEKIGFVAGSGTTFSQTTYKFTDNLFEQYGRVEYQLKQVDLDGTIHESPIIRLKPRTAGRTSMEVYPNPFNSSTTIEVSSGGNAELAILDIRGRLVKRIFLKGNDGWHHIVKWDARDENSMPVASGLYFAVLEANKQQLVRKLFLIR